VTSPAPAVVGQLRAAWSALKGSRSRASAVHTEIGALLSEPRAGGPVSIPEAREPFAPEAPPAAVFHAGELATDAGGRALDGPPAGGAAPAPDAVSRPRATLGGGLSPQLVSRTLASAAHGPGRARSEPLVRVRPQVEAASPTSLTGRATAEERGRPVLRPARVHVPPPAVRAPVEQRFGIDLAAVPVHRGPATAVRARELSALAFTEHGDVHVPAEAGPLDTGPGSRLLVHELVHVAQQRRLAPAPSVEASGLGRALEDEARRVEGEVARDLDGPRRVPGVALHRDPDTPGVGLPASAAATVVPLGVQRAAEPTAAGREHEAPEPSLDEIAARLYERISSRLKAELLVDRERAGLLNSVR